MDGRTVCSPQRKWNVSIVSEDKEKGTSIWGDKESKH